MATQHSPVLLIEVIEFMGIKPGGRYLDLTLGGGGHTDAILDIPETEVVALDRDHEALERYETSGRYAKSPRLTKYCSPFSELQSVVRRQTFDGILIDCGVSSDQIGTPERGFSFQSAGPLDMRMDKSSPKTLKHFLESVSEEELARIFRDYGEVPQAHREAKRLLSHFEQGEISDTAGLAKLYGPKRDKIHPATRVFMALRMAVNEELGEIEKTISRLPEWLKCGGRLVIITFHSVEDRLVKRELQKLAGECVCGKPALLCICRREKIVEWTQRKALKPSEAELASNPRSRSAKLRAVQKL